MSTENDRLSALEAAFDSLMASVVDIQGEVEGLKDTFSELSKQKGWSEREVELVLEFHRRKCKARLEEILISIEDSTPGYAAKLQAIIDRKRKPN